MVLTDVPEDAELFRGFLATAGDFHQCATVVRTLFGPSARFKVRDDGVMEVREAVPGRKVGTVRFTLDRWWVSAWEEAQ